MGVLVDMHQDLLARPVCGEGMPDFYAWQVLNNSNYCLSPAADKILGPLLHLVGVCESI